MIGKKIGVQATNEAVWNAFLKANNIDPSKINKVPVQFDPQPLVDGRGRRLVLVRHQRAEPAEGAGRRHHVRSCSPTTSTRSCRRPTSCKSDTLTSDRDKIKAMLAADIKGWHENLKDPALGATLAADEVRQGPEAHRGGADARVEGARTS